MNQKQLDFLSAIISKCQGTRGRMLTDLCRGNRQLTQEMISELEETLQHIEELAVTIKEVDND